VGHALFSQACNVWKTDMTRSVGGCRHGADLWRPQTARKSSLTLLFFKNEIYFYSVKIKAFNRVMWPAAMHLR
jgi:hypothetical protein